MLKKLIRIIKKLNKEEKNVELEFEMYLEEYGA